MMKIHTTQNLNSLGRMQSTNNGNIPSDELRLNKSKHMRMHGLYEQPDSYENGVSFKGKKEVLKIVKNAAEKKKWYDKVLTSRVFNKLLDMMNYETIVQATVAAVVCMGLRPLFIMLTPSKKNKQDNLYASVHSISSGVTGLATSLLITYPFAKGLKYSKEHNLKNVRRDVLERMYPNLKIETIGEDGARKAVKDWLDVEGKKFHQDFKNTRRVAKPKHISQISEETFKTMGVDIDLNAMKNKPVQEWVDRSGKKVNLELRDMFLAVNEEGMGTNFFSLQHIDKNFLKEIYPNLDISTIAKDGKRVHTNHWKNVDGSEFKLDMDKIHISSYRESTDAVPLYTGRKRFDTKDKVEKYCAYQTNDDLESTLRVPDKLGTEIKQEFLNADDANDIKNKLFGWMPDIVTRPFMAAATIALIPIIMTDIFHLQKSKKGGNDEKQVQLNNLPKLDTAPRKEVA